MATFPTIKKDEVYLFENYPHLKRWYAQIEGREAVKRGMAVPA
jgi:glutathione S-transferase